MIPRSKQRGGVTFEDSTYQRVYTSGGPWVDAGVYSFATKINEELMNGFDIPHYHKLKREGALLPLTPFSQSETTGQASGNFAWTQTNGLKARYTSTTIPHNLGSAWIASVGDCTAALGERDFAPLVQAAAARIYSSGWDSLTFASELRKTLSMFRSAGFRLARTFSDKRFRDQVIRDLADGRKTLNKAAKNWLEYRYGWRTLMYDIQDLSKALNSLDSKRSRFSERAGYSASGSSSNTAAASITGQMNGETITTDISWSASLRGTVVADIQPPTFAFNPFVTGWELVTFSFVIDWFVNVGQAIEAMSFLALATNYTAASGIQIELSKSQTVNDGTLVAGVSSVDIGSSSSSNIVYTARTPATVSSSPQVKVNLDVGKLVDLAALARLRLF